MLGRIGGLWPDLEKQWLVLFLEARVCSALAQGAAAADSWRPPAHPQPSYFAAAAYLHTFHMHLLTLQLHISMPTYTLHNHLLTWISTAAAYLRTLYIFIFLLDSPQQHTSIYSPYSPSYLNFHSSSIPPYTLHIHLLT